MAMMPGLNKGEENMMMLMMMLTMMMMMRAYGPPLAIQHCLQQELFPPLGVYWEVLPKGQYFLIYLT